MKKFSKSFISSPIHMKKYIKEISESEYKSFIPNYQEKAILNL